MIFKKKIDILLIIKSFAFMYSEYNIHLGRTLGQKGVLLEILNYGLEIILSANTLFIYISCYKIHN